MLDPKPPFLNEKTVMQILEKRKKYVDAVAVTGGEPTMHKEIPKFLKKFKEKGFAVKLDTNGFFPRVLKKCLSHVDYVALDVKTSLEKYRRLGAKDTADFLRTVEILKNGKVEYEFRATVVPGFVDEEYIPKMGEIVKGGKRFAFQQFISGDTLDKAFNSVNPCSPRVIGEFASVMKRYVANVTVRV